MSTVVTGGRASRRPRTVAVLLAGGVGSRVGGPLPKQLVEVAGRPVMEHALAAFHRHPQVDEVVVLMAAGHLDAARAMVARGGYGDKVSAVLEGAGSRSATTVRAVRHLTDRLGDEDCRVLLHDAARPLVTARIVSDCVAALDRYDAVDVAVPSADTLVEVTEDGLVRSVPDRARWRRVQTPQAFRLSVLRRAYDLAGQDPEFEATDDCSVVLRYLPEVPIVVVPGDEENIKVTRPVDLLIAERLLRLRAASEPDSGRSAAPEGPDA